MLLRWAARLAILAALVGLLILVLSGLNHRWDWSSVWVRRGAFAAGVWLTIVVSAGGMAIGTTLGLLGCALRMHRYDAPRFVGACYVECVRNTPLLVQLYILYFVVFSWSDEAVLVGMLALGIFSGAYITEIFRAGIESIDRGQTEAALSIGMTHLQAFLYVVGPQALRRIIPPLTGQFVSLVKDSSLLSVIAINELLYQAETGASKGFRYFEAYIAIAALYLALNFPLSRLSVWLERRLDAGGSS